MTRSGFVGLAGRPNVGKSTLANAIVGAKVAIVSDRPQTTRRAVRGIATDEAAGSQLVIVDLPGVQRPRDSLTERMQRRVERELRDADVAVLVVNGDQGVGPGDRFIARNLLARRSGPPLPPFSAPSTNATYCAPARRPACCQTPRTSRRRRGVPGERPDGRRARAPRRRPRRARPEGPFPYPPETRVDQPSDVHLAELIREQVLRRTREEVPHAVEVAVTEIARRDDGLIEVSRPDLGRDGVAEGDPDRAWWPDDPRRGYRRAPRAGAQLGTQVFLALRVRMREHWRRDSALLDRLGID